MSGPRCLAFAGALALCGCAHGSRATASATTAPSPLVDSRGIAMPLRMAVRHIAFRPFIPHQQIIAVAVIPPLGGADTRAGHGLAVEYARDGNALMLSEWPRRGFLVTAGVTEITASPCVPAPYAPHSVMWTTRNGLVMTLQPDGPIARGRVAREARRIVAHGACGAATSRPSPRRRRVSSSPRQSAS